LKLCELCGLENPDEARFCMRCGKDMDAVKARESFFEVPEGDAFTPQGAPDEHEVSGHRGRPQAPDSDVSDILQAEYAKAAAMDGTFVQEEEPEPGPPRAESVPDTGGSACGVCGVVNPRESRFCRNCGAGLIEPEPPEEKPRGAAGGGWDLEGLYEGQEEAGPPPGDDGAVQPGDGYGSAVPLAREEPLVPLVETALFAPISPSSDYYAGDAPSRKRKKSRGGKVVWSARDWLILIVLAVVLSAGIWLFLAGGMDLFSGGNRNLRKAGQAMSKLSSFEYSIRGAMESGPSGTFGGTGTVRYESPDRSLWEFTSVMPDGREIVTRQAQVSSRTFVNGGDGWTVVDAATARPDVRNLWSGFSSVEDLGREACGDSAECYHYKYRVAPDTVTGILGVWDPKGASDAVMEAWIDSGDHRVVKLTAQVYNVDFEGARTSVNMTFDLAATGQRYDIKAPI